MAETRWTQCEKIIGEIKSLAQRETALILGDELDAVWEGRRRREELTKWLEKSLAPVTERPEVVPESIWQNINASVRDIQESDRHNVEHLQRRRNGLREELYRLRSGRIAVSGYKWLGDSTPSYVDQRS